MGNNIGTKIKNFFIGVGKFLAKAATKAILGRVASKITGTPVLGHSLADAINSLYAVGVSDLGKGSKDFDVEKINKAIMDAFPDQDKFQVIDSKHAFDSLVYDFPKEAKKAGIESSDFPQEGKSAVMAKGGVVKKYAMGVEDLGKGSKENIKHISNNHKIQMRDYRQSIKMSSPAPVKKEQVIPGIAFMAKGGAVKKARSPAQIAATKRMLEALKKYKAMKK